jgi:hypothetical protein
MTQALLITEGKEDGFFARVFGQDRELREGVRSVLESTELWDRLQLLSGRTSS